MRNNLELPGSNSSCNIRGEPICYNLDMQDCFGNLYLWSEQVLRWINRGMRKLGHESH